MTRKTSRVDANRLRDLGFSDDLIREAVGRAERGVLEIEPPPELLTALLERARKLTPKETEQEAAPAGVFDAPAWILAALSANAETGMTLARSYARCVSMGTMPARYAEALKYAASGRDQPLVIVENHNVIEPLWWQDDPVFRQIRSACRQVNQTAKELGGPSSALVVVLRSNPEAYQPRELEALTKTLRESTSDVCLITAAGAGQYATKDVAVIGDQCVFQIDKRVHSPAEALGIMIASETTSNALEQRENILDVVRRSEVVKSNGALVPRIAKALEAGSARAAIEMVFAR